MLQCVGVGNPLGSMLPSDLLLKFLPFTMLENAGLLEVFPLKIRVKIKFLISRKSYCVFSTISLDIVSSFQL